MRRDPHALAAHEFDVVVVGGGIFGICAAWDAAARGLSVALLERRDFAHGASANCFKMVHGGIRYLQHGDVVRLRESSRERRALLRIAPHLVSPLPIAIPTYGHGRNGKELLATGARVYDLATADRNRGVADPERRIPATRSVSRGEILELFPELDPEGLTGGVIFHDGQMQSPARLAISFLHSASEAGAIAANYVEVERLTIDAGRVTGVAARDVVSDEAFQVQGRVVLNAAGGWAERLLPPGPGGLVPQPSFSRDAYFVLRRRLSERHALAVQARTRDPDALLSREARHLFLAPWRGATLAGVWHRVWEDEPDRVAVGEEELRAFVDEVNCAYPALGARLEDVTLVQCGLVLFGESRAGDRNLSYGKRSRIIDHARAGGPEGLITLLGVRYTTARLEASRAIDRVFRKLERRAPATPTETTPIYGGRIERFADYLASAQAARPAGVDAASLEELVRGHGSEYGRILERRDENAACAGRLGASTTLGAEVVHAVREEMALHLEDVVLRRTELGTAGDPGAPALEAAADLMAAELGWDAARRTDEIQGTRARFPAFKGSADGSATISRMPEGPL